MTKLKKKIGFQAGVMIVFAATLQGLAQRPMPLDPRVDLAVTYTADRTNPVGGQNEWLMGGSAELGANLWNGLGVATAVTGITTDGIGLQGVPVHLVVTTFGPRYRLNAGKLSIYGEGLLGVANGFNGVYPSNGQSSSSSNALALQVGGGVDLTLRRRFGIRAVQANWMRTQFSNTTSNVQNHLLLGSGLILRF